MRTLLRILTLGALAAIVLGAIGVAALWWR